MIARLAASIGAALPVAAAAAAQAVRSRAAVAEPIVWYFFGVPFEAAGMVAALFGCFAARFWIGAGQQLRREHRWILDVPVTSMTLATSAGLVMMMHPAPLGGLLYGAGAGVLGEGIFKLAERYMAKAMAVLGDNAPPDGPPTPANPKPAADPDAVKGIGQALQRLHTPPNP